MIKKAFQIQDVKHLAGNSWSVRFTVRMDTGKQRGAFIKIRSKEVPTRGEIHDRVNRWIEDRNRDLAELQNSRAALDATINEVERRLSPPPAGIQPAMWDRAVEAVRKVFRRAE